MDGQHAVTTTNQYITNIPISTLFTNYITHGIYKYGDDEDLTMVLQWLYLIIAYYDYINGTTNTNTKPNILIIIDDEYTGSSTISHDNNNCITIR